MPEKSGIFYLLALLHLLENLPLRIKENRGKRRTHYIRNSTRRPYSVESIAPHTFKN